MTRQRALIYIHFAAVLFGLTGVFGELIQASAAVITLGRAAFAVMALAGFPRVQRRPLFTTLSPAQLFMLIVAAEIGRATCRESVCTNGEDWVAAGSIKKKK